MPAKILVIDDDPDLVEVLRLTLEASGYEVFSAAGGAEGLEQVKQVHPDLIILDVMMDYTTQGFQVSLALRSPDPESEYAPYRDIPILMLTAIHETTPLRFTPDGDYLPVDDFVEKPIEPGELVRKVEGLLERTAVD
jgi:CheY-like chemotaxis protein